MHRIRMCPYRTGQQLRFARTVSEDRLALSDGSCARQAIQSQPLLAQRRAGQDHPKAPTAAASHVLARLRKPAFQNNDGCCLVDHLSDAFRREPRFAQSVFSFSRRISLIYKMNRLLRTLPEPFSEPGELGALTNLPIRLQWETNHKAIDLIC